MSFLPEPFFSYWISLSTEFDHGVNGYICFKWYDVSCIFQLNSPRIIFLALSCITASGTSYQLKRWDNASWASLLSFMDNEHDQPKLVSNICAHLLPLLDSVVANSVSLYILCGNLLYHNWWSFVLNCLDKDGCNTVWTPCCVVCRILLNAFLGEILHFLAITKWSSPDTFLLWTCAICND